MGLQDRLWEGVVCLAALCLVFGVTLLRLWPVRRQVGRFVHERLRSAIPRFKAQQVADPFEQRVRAECEKRQLERARLILVIGNVLAVAQVWPNLVGIIIGDIAAVLTLGQIVVVCASASAVSLINLFPRAITNRSVDVIYSMLMASLIAQVIFSAPDRLGLFETLPSIIVMSFLWGLFNMKMWLNTIWLLSIAVTISAKLKMNGHPFPPIVRSYFILWCTLSWVCHCLENSVRLELRALDSGGQLTAIRRLMNSFCDVIVELDSGLRFLHHSPRLADILLQGPLRSLQGVALSDFMPEEDDRESFAEHMSVSEEAAEHASIFHTKLRDSNGSPITMELFSLVFKGSDARRRHILGMRECTDIQPMTQPLQPLYQQTLSPPKPERIWPGTPATTERAAIERPPAPPVVEQAEVQSQVSSIGESGCAESEGGQSRSLQTSRRRRPVETVDMARKTTIINALLAWYIEQSPGACCPWHIAIEEGQRLLSSMAACPCDFDFGRTATTKVWQCKRCGIMAQEFRTKRLKYGCKLCVDFSAEEVESRRRLEQLSL